LKERSIRVGVLPGLDNASSYGKHRFIIGRELVEIGDRRLLYGVVAHEIAHDVLRHSELTYRWQQYLPLIGEGIPVVEIIGMFGLKAYSRHHEYEADTTATEILEKAGQPRWVMRYALEVLRDKLGSDGGGWFSTHPSSSNRIERLPAVPR